VIILERQVITGLQLTENYQLSAHVKRGGDLLFGTYSISVHERPTSRVPTNDARYEQKRRKGERWGRGRNDTVL
jgi:hypothetical protein